MAMGAGPTGRIFAEPTTWTGSIGVIIPRFDLSNLAEQIGIRSDSLKTGPFKDSLNPFRPLSDEDRVLWDEILAESFDRFKSVLVENREGLDAAEVDRLATGQIYTAMQARELKLIDEIGFEEDALQKLQDHLELASVRIVTYQGGLSALDLVLDHLKAANENRDLHRLMDATVPKAMYYTSWAPGIH